MNEDLKKGIIIFIVVVIILTGVYFVTAFRSGEISHKSTTNSAESSDPSYSNMIIASKTFDQADEEYMVLFYSNSDIKDDLKSVLSSYDSADKTLKLYKVNTDEKINSYVLGKTDNQTATTSEELSFKKTTLIKISSKNITLFENDEERIINELE